VSTFSWIELYGQWSLPVPIYFLTRHTAFKLTSIGLIYVIDGIFILDQLRNLFGLEPWFNPNVSTLFLVFSLFLLKLENQARTNNCFCSIIYTTPIFFALLQGAYLSALIGVVTLAIFFDLSKRSRILLFFLIIFIALFKFGILLRSLNIRVSIWKSALWIIRQDPWGIDLNRFQNNFFSHRSKDYLLLKGIWVNEADPHNLFLNFVLSFGLIGGFILLVILFYNLNEIRKINSETIPLIFLFLIQSFFNVNSVFINTEFAILLAMLSLGRL
jgi:hypothetical protein